MLSSFFTPASIAVVGAANDPSKLRGKLLRLALDSGYASTSGFASAFDKIIGTAPGKALAAAPSTGD